MNRRRDGSRIVALLTVLAASASIFVSCSASKPGSTGTAAGAYARVIRWFVDQKAAESGKRVVFVQARGDGLSIGLEIQASVVSGAESFAEVRFIDDPSEALDTAGVREGGIFLALGPAVPESGAVTIDCDEIVARDSQTTLTFSLMFINGAWALRGEPLSTA